MVEEQSRERERPPHRWLLLMHQIPTKPTAFRVKVWRRLQQIGAVGVKNSVYVLPCTEEALEDFQWLKQEIEDAGGEAMIFRADTIDGIEDGEVEALFRQARDADYGRLVKEAQALQQRIREAADHRAEALEPWEGELLKLRERLSQLQRIDFFAAPGRADADAALEAVTGLLAGAASGAGRERPAVTPMTLDLRTLRGRVWVTRAHIYVDRMACAWLIRRFVDPEARFRFIDPAREALLEGAIPFDMAGAEFGHHADRCSFETFLERLQLTDPALAAIGQIVHDIDLKDHKYARPEAAGLQLALDGMAGGDDAAALERASALFDAVYAALAAGGGRQEG